MNNRTQNGRTLIGTNVVAADAIARLSGVSAKDVAKVLIAIRAVEINTAALVSVIVDTDSIPTAAPERDGDRYQNTVEFVDQLIHSFQKVTNRHHMPLLQALAIHKRNVRVQRPLYERNVAA